MLLWQGDKRRLRNITATPDENYEVVAVTVKGVSGKSVDVQNAEGIYTFKMPAENVTVSATFKEKF